MTGKGLHSGEVARVRLWPEFTGKGRYFEVKRSVIPACIDVVEETPLCTSLCKDGVRVRTVEHLLSALEGLGVDNCRIEIEDLNSSAKSVEVCTPKNPSFRFLQRMCILNTVGCRRFRFWMALRRNG